MDSKLKILNPLIIILLLIILVIVITKDPVISVSTYPSSSSNDNVSINGGLEVVNLGNNRIVLFSTDTYSENYGDIAVLEFDEETKSFKKVSEDHLFLDQYFR
ncbi:hypothetical protein [Alkalibacterium kapii]|uniref:Uncharacterized protein n=1 Tax=Alkalibacterium kapii TaxID=426704 RepID=A0A511AVY8_9LACT|nr:hypothetical protein [Alkalibacterium kapii]GEK91802.1 hypothetical protein AKA01nite_14240 [Alkalibacterium kapii]